MTCLGIGEGEGWTKTARVSLEGPFLTASHAEEAREEARESYKKTQYKAIMKILGKRFGTVPDWVGTKLGEVPHEQLEDILDRSLEVDDLEELFSELAEG